MKHKRLKNRYSKLSNPLYLNANLIFSSIFGKLNSRDGKTLTKLREEGYQLVTSILTRYEVVRNLKNHKKTKLSSKEGLRLYLKELEDSQIL